MKKRSQTIFRVLRFVIAVGLLIYLGTSGAIEWSTLRGLATAWPLTLAALALFVTDMVVTSSRLCVLLRPHGFKLSMADSFRLTSIATFFNTYLPGASGGDLVRMYYASSGNRGQRTEVVTILLLDRALGMLALVMWPLLVVPLFPEMQVQIPFLNQLLWGAAAVSALMIGGMTIGSLKVVRESRLLQWLFAHLPLGRYAERILDTIYNYRRRPQALILGVLISLLAHTLAMGVMLLLARAMDPAGFAWEMALLLPIGFMANMIPLTPGGLGVGEAAFDALFGLAGLTGGAEILIGWRLIMIMAGLIGLLFYLQGRERFVQAAQMGNEASPAQEVSALAAPAMQISKKG